MPAGQRDKVGLAHWCAFTGGVLMVAAAYGDLPHLRCLLYAGVILACGMGVALALRWGFSGKMPGSIIPITEAPSVLRMAQENTQRIAEIAAWVEDIGNRADDHAAKLALVFRAIAETNAGAGYPAPDLDATAPLPKLSLVPAPGHREAG